MRLDIGIYGNDSVSEGSTRMRAGRVAWGCLTTGDVPLQVLLAGEALPAVGAEDHGGTTMCESATGGFFYSEQRLLVMRQQHGLVLIWSEWVSSRASDSDWMLWTGVV